MQDGKRKREKERRRGAVADVSFLFLEKSVEAGDESQIAAHEKRKNGVVVNPRIRQNNAFRAALRRPFWITRERMTKKNGRHRTGRTRQRQEETGPGGRMTVIRGKGANLRGRRIRGLIRSAPV